jgi:small GTP-binding protein
MTKLIKKKHILFVGPRFTGKTTIINKFKKNNIETKPTVGVDFFSFSYNSVYYNLWDISGDNRYENIVNIYFKNIDNVYLFIDINLSNDVIDSYIKKWCKLLIQYIPDLYEKLYIVFTNIKVINDANKKFSLYTKYNITCFKILFLNINNNKEIEKLFYTYIFNYQNLQIINDNDIDVINNNNILDKNYNQLVDNDNKVKKCCCIF